MTRRNVSVTKSGQVERAFRCDACGLVATATVRAKGSGSIEVGGLSGGSVDTAAAHAAEDFRRNSVDVLGFTPCPRCGKRDKTALGFVKLGVVVLVPMLVLCAILVWSFRDSFIMMLPLFPALFASITLWRWGRLWRSANRGDVRFDDTAKDLELPAELPKARALASPTTQATTESRVTPAAAPHAAVSAPPRPTLSRPSESKGNPPKESTDVDEPRFLK